VEAIGSPSADGGWTVRDLDALPEDDALRYELIDGTLYTTTFQLMAHQEVIPPLLGMLWQHVENHALGEVLTSGTKVVLDDRTAVGPDLIFISREQSEGAREDGFYGSPALVVEVTPPVADVERIIKHRKYAEARVPHYWIIDPDACTLEAFELSGDRYELAASVKGDETFSPKLFPGLVIPLARLFR
jgi:Uma2 family endonuclease